MSFNETGHYKNVANFNLLIEHITAYGAVYAPSKPSITLAGLQACYATANQYIQQVQDAKNHYSDKVDYRQATFSDIKKFTTQVIGNLYGTNVGQLTIESAKTIAAKIKSTRIQNPPTSQNSPDSGDPAGTLHSVSRQSYHSLYENFNDMVSLLSTNALQYDPVQPQFQLSQLAAYASSLRQANEIIDAAIVAVFNRRVERDNILYNPQTGLVNTALTAKEYVKGLFGASSPQYLAINRIKFRNRN